MGVKVAAACFQLSHTVLPCSQALASAVSSPSSLCRKEGGNSLLVCRYDYSLERSVFFGSRSTTKLHRSRSCEYPKKGAARTIKRASSASMESFSDEEFCNNLQDIALRLQLSYVNDDAADSMVCDSESEIVSDGDIGVMSLQNVIDFPVECLEPPPDWPEPAEGDWSIERKANSLDIPLSLRMIRKKIKWQQGVQEASESTYCSVKKAFSSMVFIIRELQSYTLHMREFLFYEDLQGILVRVHKEMNASFVWLFQQVFSQTPTLMMYVMILLANFSVHSMASNSAIAAIPLSCSHTEISSMMETQDQHFDSSVMRRFSAASSSGKTTSIGGNNGGSGNIRPTSNGTDGFDGSDKFRTILPDVAPQISSLGTTSETELVSGEENEKQWDSIVEEASQMQMRDEALDHETMQRLVAPVDVKIEPSNFMDYLKTEMFYRTQLVLDPNNPLILANYAQFLYLVVRDNARAEKYFKKATAVEAADAEAYSKYATFLWRAKNDLWRAEETFLEAISADPTNSYHAANYAHFLWNTGGEDTCYPLT